MKKKLHGSVGSWMLGVVLVSLALPTSAPALQMPVQELPVGCLSEVFADVVALDQPWSWNRLGAVQPHGMVFALRRDVVALGDRDGLPPSEFPLAPGQVMLRLDKRPRPLVLRVNEGQCLHIRFQNLLSQPRLIPEQPNTRDAGVHVMGMQLVQSILDDGSYVGTNGSSLVAPGQFAEYWLYAEKEGTNLLYSTAATTGGDGDGGQLTAGLFGAVNVQPAGARYYRSQVTEADLTLAKVPPPPVDPAPPFTLNYEARFPSTHPHYPNQPILNMLDGNELVYSDLTAIIVGSDPAGANQGWWPNEGQFPPNPQLPERRQPFREFTIIYHGEPGAVQAFPVFNDEILQYTLHSVRDAFAINYGTGGIGAEILANRFRVGPMHECTECLYEEFFLTSWAVGDPAMVVDKPANTPCSGDNANNCIPDPGPKANKALYPDDPSNVYHSYLQDHVKFRLLHGGPAEHHIHHLHAHQWVYSMDSDGSSYLDSQAIGPGSSFTLDIAYHGSGNRNLTAGDSIFHCHFYPHFAMGMWAMWRVHDTLELGTKLRPDGRPVFVNDFDGNTITTTRALPDAEIPVGTPIPGLVPVPGKPMAPLPSLVKLVNGHIDPNANPATNPGYPFYIPGVAGHRPPHPPLDFAKDPGTGLNIDGGLPRHVVVAGEAVEKHTRLTFEKHLTKAQVKWVPEDGTPMEKLAMTFHEQPSRPSFTPSGSTVQPNGQPANFLTNGLPRISGAPYAEPCNGQINRTLTYKAAVIQDDVILNKKGWHFPQQRFISLWQDVNSFLNGNKPPEPFFFRANTHDCINFWHTNLVPNVYELDDFQVRTPTDILGQHIHLVKFDVTSSDGSGNGWNYEDGTFSPEEVQERIHAIRAFYGCDLPTATAELIADPLRCPVAKPHPYFGQFNNPEWLGAQTTIQRWYADDTLDNFGNDKTLRTVFTHDHFGPSTHQQVGLYAGLVVEPEFSLWYHNESGLPLHTRVGPGLDKDGGPTTWQAIIEEEVTGDSYREFLFEFADFQLAYLKGSPLEPDPILGWVDVKRAVNPPGRAEVGLPKLLQRPVVCPTNPNDLDGADPGFLDPNFPDPLPPCPEAISADEPGTMSVNYRNEPIASRINVPGTDQQAIGDPGDLSKVFSSTVTRVDPDLNTQPTFYDPLTLNLKAKDPFTPLLQAYENDKVQIRVLVGAHEEGHNFNVHGIKWLFEPHDVNSGYRNSQMMGISEHFEFIVPQLIKQPDQPSVDYLYQPGGASDDLWNGLWGLIRVYSGAKPDLATLSRNPAGRAFLEPGSVGAFDFSCPKDAPVRVFDVAAVEARTALSRRSLIYLNRPENGFGRLHDPTAILYVRTSDLNPIVPGVPPTLKVGVPEEPLVLRARAGECIEVNLTNYLSGNPFDLWGYNTLPMIIDDFNNNDIVPSHKVGLHPQLLNYDVSRYDGADVGLNDLGVSQLAGPNQTVSYRWYAGDIRINPDGTVTATPIEFGATNLVSSDPIKHAHKGAIGSLIIEPEVSKWAEDTNTRHAATVKYKDPESGLIKSYREFVLQFQNDVNLRMSLREAFEVAEPTTEAEAVMFFGQPIQNLAGEDDPEDSGQKAFNYRTEPLWHRMGYPAQRPLNLTRDEVFTDVLSNLKVGADPETPIFTAAAWTASRFRLLQSGGHARNEVFTLHGHIWEQEPYVAGSQFLGDNPLSQWEGARGGHGPTNHNDILLKNGAGGKFGIVGDYLYRDFRSFDFDGGKWGIFRVGFGPAATEVEPDITNGF